MLKQLFFRRAVLVACLVFANGLINAAPASSATVGTMSKSPTVYNATPKPVLVFYGDVMEMFNQLMKSLHAAKDAKSVAAAFNKATETAANQKLPGRYQDLSKRYPEFFNDDSGSGGPQVNNGWVPPSDWVKLSADFEKQMQQFGESAGNLSAFMGTTEVETALDAFGAMMEKFNPGTED